jgi:isoquinoline 1-oxidoreductase
MENDKYSRFLEDESEFSLTETEFNRRDFMRITGAGIFVFFTIGNLEATLQRRRGRDYPTDFNAYLKIGEDGRISCFTGKIEMGQGIITSLAQMLAEELNVSLKTVDMVMGDTDLCPYDRGTTGSRSTKNFGPPLRKAAAQARAVLLQLASEILNITTNQLLVKNGIIQDKRGQHTISYAELAQGKRIERFLPDVVIKNHSEHTISGKSTLRTDALKKVTGEAQFAADILLPGMLYAKVLRPPTHGAQLKKFDTTLAEKIDGVKIVQDGNLVAALHTNPEQAEKALNKITVDYETANPTVNNRNIFEHLQKVDSYGEVVSERGKIIEGQKQSEHRISSTFYNHYVAHAPMEPHTIVAEVSNNKVRLWISTQTPFRVQSMVAEELDIPTTNVHVITPFLGGGFGGKKAGSYIMEAVRLAKITNQPVQIALTRKEEFFYDTFRPAAVIKLTSGLDRSDKIIFWDYDNFYAGSRSSEPMYDIPYLRVQSRRPKDEDEDVHPFDVGAWRGPGSNTNVFAMESQIDILAHTAGIDPLSFRLNNLSDPRMIRVLKAAADRFGHSFSTGPSADGFGIACTNYLNTYVATIAGVSVDKKSGKVQVEKMVCAQDMGEIINPQGAKLQIEGGLTMGLGYALSEEIRFEGSKILSGNFDDYEFTRFSWTPEIDVVLIDNPDLPPQGCGEPAITTTGAVIANAIFDAIGVRLYTLPMTADRIKAGLDDH